MAKSAPFGSNFHDDKIQSGPDEPRRNQQKTSADIQAGSSEAVSDPTAKPVSASKGRKSGKKR